MANFSSCRKANEDTDSLEITADYGVLIRKRKSTATISFNVKRKYEYDFLPWMLPPTAMISGLLLIFKDGTTLNYHTDVNITISMPPTLPISTFFSFLFLTSSTTTYLQLTLLTKIHLT
jgi:hypothetical protein